MYFFFNDPAHTEIYTHLHTLSLPVALPLYRLLHPPQPQVQPDRPADLPPRLFDPAAIGGAHAMAHQRREGAVEPRLRRDQDQRQAGDHREQAEEDRKSTRLNYSH